MPRFLHVADVHLGFDRYGSKERSQDFFYAFYDALKRYAVDEHVDFVVIAGDLFEYRTIQPATLNQAQICLRLLDDAGIPAIAIEGNHDNLPYGTKTSWLRYLADWELLMLLEPGNVAAGEPLYQPWNVKTKRGGYIDLDCGVRVLGSAWYGAATPMAVEQIAEAIAQLEPTSHPQVLLLHHGLEGQIARYAGALRYAELLPLKQAGIDYLALGHIHKNYAVEGWIFNPGSIEANSVEESRYDRGVYLVELDAGEIRAELKRDYQQRPIVRLELTTQGSETQEEVEQLAIACVQSALDSGKIITAEAPIVELRIAGHVGFDRFELDVRTLQQQLQALSGALIFLLKYEADSVVYQSALAEDRHREEIEADVYLDLVEAHSSYKKQAQAIARGLIELKNLQLEGRSELELHAFVETLLNTPSDTTKADP